MDKDILIKNDISYAKKVDKLTLGFVVKLTKWENIKIMCDEIQKKQFADNKLSVNWFDKFKFLDILFHNEQWIAYNFDCYIAKL